MYIAEFDRIMLLPPTSRSVTKDHSEVLKMTMTAPAAVRWVVRRDLGKGVRRMG